MSIKTQNSFKFGLKDILARILFVCFAYPSTLLLIAPLLIARKCVQILAKFFKPEYREMLSSYSALMATFEENTQPKQTKWTPIVGALILGNKTVDLDQVIRIGEEVCKNPRFTRATQLMEKWKGFYFWKQNPGFSFQNQLTIHREPISNAEFQSFRKRYEFEPFEKDLPLWGIHIFEKYSPESKPEQVQVAVLLRVHHSVMDWLSIVEIFKEIHLTRLGSKVPENLKHSKSRKTIGSAATFDLKNRITFLTNLLVTGPYEAIQSLIQGLQTTMGNLLPTDTKATFEYNSFDTNIPIALVQNASEVNGVTPGAIVFSALTAACRQLLIDTGVDPLPETLTLSGPYRNQAPLKELTNHFSVIPIQAPVGESDPFKRLQLANQEFLSPLKASGYKMHALYGLINMIGLLPHSLMKLIAEYPTYTSLFSFAPGPSNLDEMLGVQIQDLLVRGGMPFGNMAILGFYSCSINNTLYMRIHGDRVLFPDEIRSERFMRCLIREIELLKNGNRTPTV